MPLKTQHVRVQRKFGLASLVFSGRPAGTLCWTAALLPKVKGQGDYAPALLFTKPFLNYLCRDFIFLLRCYSSLLKALTEGVVYRVLARSSFDAVRFIELLVILGPIGQTSDCLLSVFELSAALSRWIDVLVSS